MTEDSVKYVDPVDGSTLTVEPVGHADFEGYLRFTVPRLATDLTRADVQSLIQYALEWMEGTKPKPPTTPGSVVRVVDRGAVDIFTRLNENGKASLGVHGPRDLWVSQYGTFWTDDELMVAGFEVVYDAGKSE